MLKTVHMTCQYRVQDALLDETVTPVFSWQLHADDSGVRQVAYRLCVYRESGGSDNLDMVWESGRKECVQSVGITCPGLKLAPAESYAACVKTWDNRDGCSDFSEPTRFHTGLYGPQSWRSRWIRPRDNTGGVACLRREFSLDKPVRRAVLFASALGLYEMRINGRKVGDRFLTPGWTSYMHRVQYQRYDVTELLESMNAWGVLLGPGWYAGNICPEKYVDHYGGIKKAFIAQLHIEYEDGGRECLITDERFACGPSPVVMSDIYQGEEYDQAFEQPGWDSVLFEAHHWERCAEETVLPTNILTVQEGPPVIEQERITPVAVQTAPSGEAILDFGQNMAGFVEMRLDMPAGGAVTLRHGEILDGNGNLYTDNLSWAAQKVTVRSAGRPFTYRPHFTHQGFRYVAVSGIDSVRREDFTGVVIHADMEPLGTLECSEPLLNQLVHNITWSQKGNFIDVPTDCPQRAERFGWTGDAQMFIRTACYNMQVAPVFYKWLADLKLEQDENGVPHIIPNNLGCDFRSSAGWGDAAVICPWTVYLMYGDTEILRRQFDSMAAWVDYIRAQGDDPYLWNTGNHFGDWLALDAEEGSCKGATDEALIATAFYAYSCTLVAKAAAVLGRDDDASRYFELEGCVRDAFNRAFISKAGGLTCRTQTAQVVALRFNLLDGAVKQRAVDTLAALIHERGDHLTTGFIGTPYLCHVLSDNGHTDLAYTLLLKRDLPSWLYQVTMGATTIWEHWDGMKEDGSLWDANMNSFNHYGYGSIGDWLYGVMAGIQVSAAVIKCQ